MSEFVETQDLVETDASLWFLRWMPQPHGDGQGQREGIRQVDHEVGRIDEAVR